MLNLMPSPEMINFVRKDSANGGDLNLTSRCFDAATRLHQYLDRRHWDGSALIGPDPGIRLNYRIGRFIKSYLNWLSWNDEYYYLQAQGYWTLSNWSLFECTREERYRDIAVRCSEYMLTRQREEGAWVYPNREWKGRVATVEGIWGSLGLLESYRKTENPAFLAGALRWHRFLTETIGFQRIGDELAINYFADRRGARVPNNSADTLRFLAELADASGESAYLQPSTGLLTFLKRVQKSTGEFPYTVKGTAPGKLRSHFQCYQYNAFQCLGLCRYHELTHDPAVLPIIESLLRFLRQGTAEDGHAFYECGNEYRAVTYHTGALAVAFLKAREVGLDAEKRLADQAYSHLLGLQSSDGGFPYSHGDYRLFSDHRSYPRQLAIILYHLLLRVGADRTNSVQMKWHVDVLGK
jgi:hypothetical protein